MLKKLTHTWSFKKLLPKSCFFIGALKAGLLHKAVVSPTMPFKGDRSSWVTSSPGFSMPGNVVKKNGAFWSCSHVELVIFKMYPNLYDACTILQYNIYIYMYNKYTLHHPIYQIPSLTLALAIWLPKLRDS